MSAAADLLPADAVFSFVTERPGPVRAEEFEAWPQEPDAPVELVEGWVMPMTPGTYDTGRASRDLLVLLAGIAAAKGWELIPDARHRLPAPAHTVVFPDLALHCVAEPGLVPGTRTVARVPDLVIEILGDETARRDVGPDGVKFLAYQMSGVREYFYCWPDGQDAAAFWLENGVFVPIRDDADGFFASAILGTGLRLVPARARRPSAPRDSSRIP